MSHFVLTTTMTTATSDYASQAGSDELLAEPLNSDNCQVTFDDLSEVKDSVTLERHDHNFQDIHGNYAKRRYKNVESKVGRYIASIRAEERKRRAAKLVRCSSAPHSFSLPATTVPEVANSEEQHKGYSTNDLYKLQESTSDYVDTEVMTSSAYSNSTNGAGTSSNGASRHESSDDAVNSGADFIDKQTYAQLIFEKEHLETLLEEKRTECLRHRRNVDFLRIELTNCQDELQRTRANFNDSNMRYTTGFVGYPFAARPNYSLEASKAPNAVTKATQTDTVQIIENVCTPKRLSANENILRLRTNSNSFSKKHEISNRCSYDFSEESKAVCKSNTRKLQSASPPASPNASTKSSPSQSEFTYYDRRYAPISTLNTSADSNVFNEIGESSNKKSKRMPAAIKRRRQLTTNFRQRFSRFFKGCTRCADPNQSFDAYGEPYDTNTMEMMQSPTPLLNRSNGNLEERYVN